MAQSEQDQAILLLTQSCEKMVLEHRAQAEQLSAARATIDELSRKVADLQAITKNVPKAYRAIVKLQSDMKTAKADIKLNTMATNGDEDFHKYANFYREGDDRPGNYDSD